jgi:hypothetical protein
VEHIDEDDLRRRPRDLFAELNVRRDINLYGVVDVGCNVFHGFTYGDTTRKIGHVR